MIDRIKRIVIVGGGTAGWLTAGLLAAKKRDHKGFRDLFITLVEAPDVPIIGVGEGTWPTIRKTLRKIGLDETEFLVSCNASFKQGSRFEKWVTGVDSDFYVHPFELPFSQDGIDLLTAWQTFTPQKSFAEAVCVQSVPDMRLLAPKQSSMPDFAGVLNYAYHLDATKMVAILRSHIIKKMEVTHVIDHVCDVKNNVNGEIVSLNTLEHGEILGDLFVDCTGLTSLLIGQHYKIPFIDQSHVLFNDRAVVTQLPIKDVAPILSETISTAHDAGWIWDIGLTNRRGIGCVYASNYMADTIAEQILRDYCEESCENIDEVKTRLLKFQPGYRQKFWHKNCLAIGLSAGFLEPLEASALVLVELSADMLAENLPMDRISMDIEAVKFNQLFKYRWEKVVEFLKLHYVLSQREEPYWVANRELHTIPEQLFKNLQVWRHRVPSRYDFQHHEEIFSATSYQFILYGMGKIPEIELDLNAQKHLILKEKLKMVSQKQKRFTTGLPTNRALLRELKKMAS